MRIYLKRHISSLRCAVSILVVFGAVAIYPAQAVCARTPGLAASSTISLASLGVSLSTPSADEKYRVTATTWDPVLQQKWTLVARCEHPEWPALAFQKAGSGVDQASVDNYPPLPPAVRAGDIVRLWSAEERLRIEVAAVAEESGGLGKTIRMRFMRTDAVEQQMIGIIRGPLDVEMSR